MPGRLRHKSGRRRRRARRRAATLCVAAGVVFGALMSPFRADAQYRVTPSVQTGLPVLLNADEVNYDDQLGIVTARGHVEIAQGERILRADVVSFNRLTNTVTASGNISLVEPTGEVMFADYMELMDDLRDGVIQNLRMLLADQSRLAAVSARRAEGGAVTVARRAVYSPCDLCKDDPTLPPLWQIKAARITHDAEAKEIRYTDAWLEVGGIPVFYTPYMAHPDGTVPRRSGFLMPAYLSSSVTGPQVTVPYYVVIDDSSDLTLEPMFFQNQNYPLLGGQLRARTATGELNGTASATELSRAEDPIRSGFRGHVKANGHFDIDDDWRWGLQVERATDPDYLQRYRLLSRYGFVSSTTLTSNVFREGFFDRSYAAANTFAFQSLRAGDKSGLSPIVLPALDYNYVGEPGKYGGHYTFDANTMYVTRTHGTRDERLVVRGGWELPYIAPSGEIYTLTASMRGDVYHTSTLGGIPDPSAPAVTGTQVRPVPELGVGWRWPFARRDGDIRTIVEPTVFAAAAPVYGVQARYPNEDSRAVDFDATNLFRLSRFDGYDRVEGGERISYGINTTFIRDNGGRGGVFLGQSYRLQRESPFLTGTGLDTQSSNYVGRIVFSPHPFVSARINTQLDRNTLSATRDTASLSLGPQAFRVSGSYIFVDKRTQANLTDNVEQVGLVVDNRLTPNWRTQLRYLTSIAHNGGELSSGATLFYEDECLVVGLDYTRRFTGTPDAPPDTAFIVRVIFRNLGQITTNVASSSGN